MIDKAILKLSESCKNTNLGNAFSEFRRKILDTGLDFTEEEIIALYNSCKFKRAIQNVSNED